MTGTVAVIGRRSGCLLMEPIGREVGASGRAVEGLALEVKGLAGRVVVTWVVVRGPEVTREQYREKTSQRLRMRPKVREIFTEL